MEAPVQPARVLRFGIYELDSQSGELRRHGLKIRLPDQAFQILRLLLDRAGEVVTREELRQRLWSSDTFVDFDVGVNSAIRKLREALDDSAENPRFVETLPRRGYRFIAPVKPARADQIPEPVTPGNATSGSRVQQRWIAGGLLLAAMIVVLALVYQRGWWVRLRAGAAPGQIRSLAVLPFENLTGDPAQDYFVDGMTDALTTDLVQIGGLQVISRTSAMQYKRAKKPLPAIGQELNVDGLVEGAIVRSGQHVRITAQLIHAATDRHVWAHTYEGELSDVVRLQQEVTRAIVTAIEGRLDSPAPARAAESRAVNPQAYDAYLKGVFVEGQQTYEGFRHAVAYFEDAVAKQPDFALAYAAIARAQLQLLYVGSLSPRETIPKAEAAARKALQLDEGLAQPHRTLGTILHNFYWQWEAGNKEFRRARELDANSAENHANAAAALIRSLRFEEAIAETEQARKLDPLSLNAYMTLAAAYRAAGQYDRAIAEFRRILELDPRNRRGHFQLGATFMMMGRSNDAIGELETAVKMSADNSRFQAYLGYAYAAAGRPLDARRILNELESRARQEYVSSFGMALILDALGQKESALAAIERAYQDRAVEFSQMAQYPRFVTIGADPRFQATMRRIGLRR
jgi:TolB-like protein/DNA-binding winged helix-turn-helix (wHTH) protein/Tfp pilus assembly protein PilF